MKPAHPVTMPAVSCKPTKDDTADAAGWRAGLTLAFARHGGRTVLTQRRHYGPLRVQRPFYPEADGTCHVYLLHPPGGLVSGDRLQLDIAAAAGSRVLLTSPAAQKFYRGPGVPARVLQRLRIDSGAAVEWLPLETIVFDGAHGVSQTTVELAAGARFTGWEITCLGRHAADERFCRGEYRQRFEILRQDGTLWTERALLKGNHPALDAPWGLAGYPVTAILVHVGGDADCVGAIRDVTAGERDNELFSVTKIDAVIVCRYLGQRAERARTLFMRAWEVLRRHDSGRAVCAPRIWNT